jgi:hypothetical protein
MSSTNGITINQLQIMIEHHDLLFYILSQF